MALTQKDYDFLNSQTSETQKFKQQRLMELDSVPADEKLLRGLMFGCIYTAICVGAVCLIVFLTSNDIL